MILNVFRLQKSSWSSAEAATKFWWMLDFWHSALYTMKWWCVDFLKLTGNYRVIPAGKQHLDLVSVNRPNFCEDEEFSGGAYTLDEEKITLFLL